jgi:hypothetical protein
MTDDSGSTPDRDRRAAHPLAVGALGGLLFSYPLLAVFDVPATVLGVPVLWAYLFVAWAALVVVMALAVRRWQ